LPGDGQDGLVAEAEFETDDAEVSEELEAEFEGDSDGEGDDDIDVVVELSAKEQSARSLEIRRAIEERMDKRQLDDDLEYLDMDLDD
jgi:hypothetical protein